MIKIIITIIHPDIEVEMWGWFYGSHKYRIKYNFNTKNYFYHLNNTPCHSDLYKQLNEFLFNYYSITFQDGRIVLEERFKVDLDEVVIIPPVPNPPCHVGPPPLGPTSCMWPPQMGRGLSRRSYTWEVIKCCYLLSVYWLLLLLFINLY